MADTDYNKEYLFFKDIIPDFLNSDRSGGGGFSDLNRLTTLLHSWGFSDVDVSNVTEWKISGKNQYTDQGPRLEWKGNLFVKASGLDLLKCKNKNKTSSQTCTDIQGNDYILLNTHASGYSGATWKWIHISEFGFAIRQDKCYLSSGESTMNNIVEFMTEKRETPKIETNISKDNKVFPESIANYTWPIGSYYVPNYLINNNNINGWGNTDSIVNTKNFDYRIYIDYGTSEANSHRVCNFNLVDEASVVVYSDMDTPTQQISQHKLKYTDQSLFINDTSIFNYFNNEQDLLLLCVSSGFDADFENNSINITLSGRIPGGYGLTPQTPPSIKSTGNKTYSLKASNIHWDIFPLTIQENVDYVLENIEIENNSYFNEYLSSVFTKDVLEIQNYLWLERDSGTIYGPSKQPSASGIDFCDLKYDIGDSNLKSAVSKFTLNGLHVNGNKRTYSLKLDQIDFEGESCTANATASGKAGSTTYRGESNVVYTYQYVRKYCYNNKIVKRIAFNLNNAKSQSKNYIYGNAILMQFNETITAKVFTSVEGINEKLYALVCLKNYKKLHMNDNSPIFRLSTNGNSLECEVHNLYDIDLPCTLKLGGTTLSHTIPANYVYDFVFEYGWSNEESLNSAVASYENPWFGNTVEVPFSEMYRIHDRSLSLYRYLEGSDHIILVHNNTTEPTTVSVYNNNISSPLGSLTSTKTQDFIRLTNYQDTPADYLDILTVKYYHPDKCQWFTISYRDIPHKTGIISTKTETYKWYQGGVSSGQTYKTDWLPTNIYLSDWDRFSHATSNVSGWSPSVGIETRLNSRNQYEWRCIFHWNGGGPNYSGGTVTLTCHQLTFNN